MNIHEISDANIVFFQIPMKVLFYFIYFYLLKSIQNMNM